MDEDINDQLALIVGYSGTGKSASLRNIRNQENWLYLNTEAGKRLPCKNSFESYRIVDPYQVHEAFDYGTSNPGVKGIIVDSVTFLLDAFETQYVLGSTNTMQGWSNFAQFFKVMMQEKVVKFGKPVLMLAHTKDELDEASMTMKTSVPVKGSLKNQGIEALTDSAFA